MGAGGAARAVVFTLLKAGSAVTILNRTVSRAEALAEDLRPHAGGVRLSTAPLDAEVIAALAPESDLVVNTTSIGMTPHEEGDPWPVDVLFPANAIAYDLVYAPLETSFLRTATASGARTIDGLQMLLYQGVLAFEAWTGHRAPADVMMAQLLKGRNHS